MMQGFSTMDMKTNNNNRIAKYWYGQQFSSSTGPYRIGSSVMKFIRMVGVLLARLGLLVGAFGSGVMVASAQAQTALQDIGFTQLPGSGFEIALEFNGVPPDPAVFLLEAPARLTMDFAGVRSELAERRFPLDFSSADSVMILEAQGRTRMVVNLVSAAPYSTRVQGNTLVVVIGGQDPAVAGAAATAAVPAPQPEVLADTSGFVPVSATASEILGIDFKRGDGGAGQIIISLGSAGLNASINQVGSRLEIEFAAATVGREQQARLDVTDFATPVQSVSLYAEDASVMVVADINGDFEYLAYQKQNQYIVDVLTVAEAAQADAATGEALYSGEPISMNFQNIDVRTALQILADFNDFSLVVGDNVTGTMALRLKNVPWDQALDMVLRPRGLGKRLVGNVLYVAPADEIAQAELRELEASQQTEALAPLVTEYIEVNYANALDVLRLLQGSGGAASAAAAAAAGAPATTAAAIGGILSSRGRASVDARTNTIIVQDVEPVIADIRRLLARLDVPVKQVLIEARIVNASTSFSKALGIRWGGNQTFPDAGDRFLLGGSLGSTVAMSNNITTYNQAIASAVAGGTPLAQAMAQTTLVGPSFPEALLVDLGVDTAGASTIAIGYQGDNGLLQLELSALEASGNGEVIAQPKVTTQDKQQARIESGLQIPYQAQAGGTAGGSTTEFVTAALSLDVTPQITPDGRIIMMLDIHQDSVVPGSGAVPAIATNSVTTRVLVNDGDTIVLGGVFREETTTSVTKTPLLGDLPYIGNIFKRTQNSETKTELLIFITPSIINDLL